MAVIWFYCALLMWCIVAKIVMLLVSTCNLAVVPLLCCHGEVLESGAEGRLDFSQMLS